MTPAIVTLFAAGRRAKKNGELAFGVSLSERGRIEKMDSPIESRKPLLMQVKEVVVKIDIFGPY